MTFNNFLELIKNLNQDTNFYLLINDQKKPLSKITVAHDEFLALPGHRGMSKKQIIKLFGQMDNRSLTLWIYFQNKRIPVYGLQISNKESFATLM